jgi:hypothetical protein
LQLAVNQSVDLTRLRGVTPGLSRTQGNLNPEARFGKAYRKVNKMLAVFLYIR